MLDPKLIPTRLVAPADQVPVVIRQPAPPSRLRVLYLVIRFAWFFAGVLVLFLRRRLTSREYARRLRFTFETLGGLWVKLGQLLSLRTDVFSRDFCMELARMQDQVDGFPTEMARQIIKDELGAPVEQHFDQFEEAPFAAASIGQIHRARLRVEGVWVAIKVQRPYAAWAFRREMDFVRFVVRVVETLWFIPNLHWDEMLWELNQILAEEIDYRYEATSTRRMRKTLSKHGIYVPQVFESYSSRRVLVTEFVHAVLMADYIRELQTDPFKVAAWCEENNVKPKRLARRLYFSLWRQLLEDNLFHGDLHPGNIILLRDSRMALIDFGSVGSMEREYQQKYYLLIKAMASLDFAKAADLLFLISGALPPRDLGEVKQKLIRALRVWELRTYTKGLPYHEKSMSNVANELIKILFQYECSADWSFLRITRAQETVDQSLRHLNPEANYTRLTEQYFRRAEWRAQKRARQPQELRRYIRSVIEVLKIPAQLSENAMFQGWIIRRHAQVFRGSASKIANFFAMLFGRAAWLVALFGVFLLFDFLYQHHPEWLPGPVLNWFEQPLKLVPKLDYGPWLVILAAVAFLYRTLTGLKRHLSQKERSRESE